MDQASGTGRWDGCTALALAMLPNLESVNMVAYSALGHHDLIDAVLYRTALQQYTGESSHFNKLHTVTIQHDESGMDGFPLENIFQWLAHDSLTTFKGTGIAERGIDTLDLDQNTEFGIFNLSLSSNHGMETLTKYLKYFPSLTRFEYENCRLGQHFDLIPSALRTALKHLRPCLQELVINNSCSGWEYATSEDPEAWQPIGFLVHFDKLRRIEATAQILHGREEEMFDETPTGEPTNNLSHQYDLDELSFFFSSLPPWLEHLTIRDCTVAVFYLFRFLHQKPPALKELNLIFRNGLYLEDGLEDPSWLEPPLGTFQDWDEAALDMGVVVTRLYADH